MAKQERKLPEVLEHDFIITDESVNRYGWRLIVDGINTSLFEKNPVCVVEHNQRMVSIGRWVELSKKDGVFKGKLQFDRNDEYAVYLYWKYADGYMSAISLSVLPISESDRKEDLLPGQRYATVTESDLLEISVVTIPAQGNAVKLCYEDRREYKLNLLTNTSKTMEKDAKTVEQLQAELQVQKRLNADNLIKLHKQRGVVSDGEVEPLKELALSSYENVSKMLDARAVPVTTETKTERSPAETLADNLVELHFKRGAITEPEKAIYKTSAIPDYEGTRKVLEAKQGTAGLQTFVQGMQADQATTSGSDDRSKWGYLDYYKKDMQALNFMQKNEADKYNKLVASFDAENAKLGVVGQPEG